MVKICLFAYPVLNTFDLNNIYYRFCKTIVLHIVCLIRKYSTFFSFQSDVFVKFNEYVRMLVIENGQYIEKGKEITVFHY